MVAATPELRAPTPILVLICTDSKSHWLTSASPKPVAQQFGEFGPVTVADIPVLTGAVNPQGLVKIVAVTVAPAFKALSLIFSTIPMITASTGITTVLDVKLAAAEVAPKPTQLPFTTGRSEAK